MTMNAPFDVEKFRERQAAEAKNRPPDEVAEIPHPEPIKPPKLHCMIDIETFGTNNEAVILSIGAVKFDPNFRVNYPLDEEFDNFHVGVTPESCEALGLKTDMKTVMWWMDKDRDEARKRLFAMERVDLASTLDGFLQWYGPKSLPTWGNGASFDNVIMRSAFKACGMNAPWQFWDDRCYRTLKNLMNVKRPYNDEAHSALADAQQQARHLQLIVAKLGITL